MKMEEMAKIIDFIESDKSNSILVYMKVLEPCIMAEMDRLSDGRRMIEMAKKEIATIFPQAARICM